MSAPEPSGLAQRVAREAGSIDRAGTVRWQFLRLALAVVAVTEGVLAAEDLLGSGGHGARHLGAFALSYSVGLAAVAARPARARAFTHLTATLAAAMAVAAIADAARGEARLLAEVQHVVEIAGLVLVLLLASRRGQGAAASPPQRLNLVVPPPGPKA
ncbi:MAG: hypothetical protein ACT4OS_05350 [Acidimicrobiales bacterium]